MPQMYLWNSHPRVYLPIEETGWAKCPYCGAEYTLQALTRPELPSAVLLVGLFLDQPRAELQVDALLDRGALVVGDVDRARELDEVAVEGLPRFLVADAGPRCPRAAR